MANRIANDRVSVWSSNDRINFAAFGCGGMGSGHLSSLVKRGDADNLKVRAVSDVYQRRLTRAQAAWQDEGYRDHRKLLERKDIEVMLIATTRKGAALTPFHDMEVSIIKN